MCVRVLCAVMRCLCPLSSSTFTPYYIRMYILCSCLLYTICSVYVNVNVDMNLNVCIMPHRHLRELRAISVLFVTVKFRCAVCVCLDATDDDIKYSVGCMNYESGLSVFAIVLYSGYMNRFNASVRPWEISIFSKCSGAKVLRWKDKSLMPSHSISLCIPPPSSILHFITRWQVKKPDSSSGFEWKSDWMNGSVQRNETDIKWEEIMGKISFSTYMIHTKW